MSNSGFRYMASVTIAVGVTLAAFFAMHLLVLNDQTRVAVDQPLASIRFQSVEIDPAIDPKKRFVRPVREEVEPLPPIPTPALHKRVEPPPIARTDFLKGGVNDGFVFPPPGGEQAGSGGSEGSCRTRIAPQYPREMAVRGIEGAVTLEFTITAAGTMRDVVVVRSNPSREFDAAATRAVARWRCQPKIENGAAVEQRVTQTIEFKLDS